MKYYDSIHTIPLSCLIPIQRSINEGKPDFRYMIIGSDIKMPKRVNKRECKKAHDNILFQMPELDINLSKKWALYLSELRRIQIKDEINDHLEMIGKRRKGIDLNRSNIAFGNYLDEFQLRHTDFEFKLYSLKGNYRELWKEKYPSVKIPKKLIEKVNKNNGLYFFLFEEYFDFLDDFKELDELVAKMIMVTDDFLDNFIEGKIEKYNKIRWIEKRLNKFFISIGDAKKWKMIRTDFFAINRLKCVPISDDTLIDQVIVLRDIMNQTIDLKQTSYSELERIKVQAKAKAKSNKESLKPGASG